MKFYILSSLVLLWSITISQTESDHHDDAYTSLVRSEATISHDGHQSSMPEAFAIPDAVEGCQVYPFLAFHKLIDVQDIESAATPCIIPDEIDLTYPWPVSVIQTPENSVQSLPLPNTPDSRKAGSSRSAGL